MKKLLIGLVAGLILGGLAGMRLRHAGEEHPSTGKAEATPAEESMVQHASNGVVFLKLDTATQTRMGLETAALPSCSHRATARAAARVLDAAPLQVAVSDLISAQLEAEAAAQESDRTRVLANQQNASERALKASELASEKARAQLDAARLRLLSAWGPDIANRKDLRGFAASIVAGDAALLRVDATLGTAVADHPAGVRLVSLDSGNQPFTATVLGPAPSIDAQLQGPAFLCIVQPNAGRLKPGGVLIAYLDSSDKEQQGVVVPREAILRYEGEAWVYRQDGTDSFQRVGVVLDAPLDDGWFVNESLEPGQKVVTRGAAQLLSEELKGEGGPE